VGIPSHVAVDVGGRCVEKDLEPPLKVLVLLARVDGVAEQLFEVLERELVHRVDVGHVSDDEVQRRAAYSDHPVPLSSH